MSLHGDGTAGTSQLARVAVKPPPFCRSDPSLWFIQLDAQFRLGNITVDDTQFYTAISALESEVLQSVRDIILNPPATDKYKTLKEKLIAVYAESETVKIKRLLQDLPLGDMKPSQLLSKMSDLSAGNLSEPMLKTLWLNRLPGNMQAILAASSEPLIQLAGIADKIHELASPVQLNAVQVSSQSVAALQAQINELSQQVAKLLECQNQPQRSRSASRNRQYRSHSRKKYNSPPPGICFYHHNFGKKAKKCSPPCNYQGN